MPSPPKVLDLLAQNLPLWKRRAAISQLLRDMDGLSGEQAREVLAQVLTVPPPSGTQLLTDYQMLIKSLTRVVMLEGIAPPPETAAALTHIERAELVAELRDDALVAVAEALLPIEEAINWIGQLIDRYVRIVSPARALALVHPNNKRWCVYDPLAAEAGLVPHALAEAPDVISGLGTLFGAQPVATLRALADLPLQTHFAVAQAVKLDHPGVFVQVALSAARMKPAKPAEAAELGGLCGLAAEVAVELGDSGSSAVLYKTFKKTKSPVTWEGEELADYQLSNIEEASARDLAAERRKLLESDDEVDVQDDAVVSLLVGANVDRTFVGHEGAIIQDVRGRCWYVSGKTVRELGSRLPVDQVVAGNQPTLVELGPEVLMAQFENCLVLFRDSWMTVIGTQATVPSRPADVSRYSFRAQYGSYFAAAEVTDGVFHLRQYWESSKAPRPEQRSSVPASDKVLLDWLAKEVKADCGFKISERQTDPKSLMKHLRDCEAADWPAVPELLNRMGFSSGPVTVTSRSVGKTEIERLDPALEDHALTGTWSRSGALAFDFGSLKIEMCTPAELTSAMPPESIELEGAYRVVVRSSSGKPVVLMRVDDGTLESDSQRYAIQKKGAWDGEYSWESALWIVLEKPVEASLASFVGRKALATTHVGDKVTRRPEPKKVPRRKSIKEAWTAFSKWRSKNEIDVDFQKGATKKMIEKVTKQFPGLPAALLECLTRHNGDDDGAGFAGWSMMGISQIESEYAFWIDFKVDAPPPADDPRLPKTWWDPAWVPFASSGSGDFLAVDTSKKGEGRVILALSDPAERRVIAPSFEIWFLDFVAALESGTLEWGGLDELFVSR